MIEVTDLEEWLRRKSTSIEQVGSEIVFTHFNGAKSLLVTRESWRDDLLPISNPRLVDFYQKYLGASVGSSSLMIATLVQGGLRVSQGFSLPDFEQVRSVATRYDVRVDEEDDLFMVGSAWMFFYGYNRSSARSPLRCYDRDYHVVDEDRSFESVLDDWWRILLDNTIR